MALVWNGNTERKQQTQSSFTPLTKADLLLHSRALTDAVWDTALCQYVPKCGRWRHAKKCSCFLQRSIQVCRCVFRWYSSCGVLLPVKDVRIITGAWLCVLWVREAPYVSTQCPSVCTLSVPAASLSVLSTGNLYRKEEEEKYKFGPHRHILPTLI